MRQCGPAPSTPPRYLRLMSRTRTTRSVTEPFGWAEHAEGQMVSAPVVDSLDPVADGELSGGAGGPQVSVVELDF